MRLGMIGAGFVAGFHTRALQAVRGFELTGLLERRGSPALAARAEELGVGKPETYDTIEELCNNVDVVAILCPNDTRVTTMQSISKAVARGANLKGVMCEKPLGRTVDEAKQMVSLANQAGLKTAYLENQIFMPGVNAAMEQLDGVRKSMGSVALVRSAEEHGGPHEPWFWDPVKQGGGVLSDMGCHSIAVGWYMLTPRGAPLTSLTPIRVQADVALLKWGRPPYVQQLLAERGVDYMTMPAEDYASGTVTFKSPDGQIVKASFADSWMFDKQGLRLAMEAIGPGFAFDVNSMVSPSTIFIADAAAAAIADGELALEKSQASRGLLPVIPNEPELYGYVDELRDAAAAFAVDRDGFLPWSYGLEIARLVNAAYMAAEAGTTIDLLDPTVQRELDRYVSKIALGQGAEVLFR